MTLNKAQKKFIAIISAVVVVLLALTIAALNRVRFFLCPQQKIL